VTGKQMNPFADRKDPWLCEYNYRSALNKEHAMQVKAQETIRAMTFQVKSLEEFRYAQLSRLVARGNKIQAEKWHDLNEPIPEEEAVAADAVAEEAPKEDTEGEGEGGTTSTEETVADEDSFNLDDCTLAECAESVSAVDGQEEVALDVDDEGYTPFNVFEVYLLYI
jgi:hypothetical protein